MNRLQIFSIMLYMLSSQQFIQAQDSLEIIDVQLDVTPQDTSINNVNNDEPITVPKTVIPFFTQDDDDTQTPSGQYWPGQIAHYIHGKQKINTASAYIEQTSYSDIVEYPSLQDEMQAYHLGYFTDPQSDTIVYLYGTKDTYIPNDAQDEQLIDDEDTDNQPDHTNADMQDNNL